jgi:hypothetical protein
MSRALILRLILFFQREGSGIKTEVEILLLWSLHVNVGRTLFRIVLEAGRVMAEVLWNNGGQAGVVRDVRIYPTIHRHLLRVALLLRAERDWRSVKSFKSLYNETKFI